MTETDKIILSLRAHQTELRAAGIRGLCLFGSFARGDFKAASDLDLAAEIDPEARIGLFKLSAIERRLGEIVGRHVDLLAEPVEKARLQANIDQDRVRVF